MEYTDVHRAFLQGIANHGAVRISDALKLLAGINSTEEENITERDLDMTIKEINKKIAPYDQEIKRIKHDLIKQEFVVFANTIEDEVHMMQKYYTETDRDYFRLLLREITLNELKIQRIVALNLISSLAKPLKKNRAEKLIDEWMGIGYFLEQENLIYFGPKTLAEFSDYLKKNYSDFISNCHLCLTTTLMGVSCDDCEKSFHRDCLRKALIQNRNCPSCKASWEKPA